MSRAMEKAYLWSCMQDPKEKARLRLAACERHEQVMLDLARRGRYRNMTNDQFLDMIMEHSETIDEYFDRDGWRR
jgi:hypothetical protein